MSKRRPALSILPEQVQTAPNIGMDEQPVTSIMESTESIGDDVMYIPECECFHEGGADSKTLYKKCTKNQGHPDFIAIKDFTMEHLPTDLRNEQSMKVIEEGVHRTVKISVSFTSHGRPDTYPNKTMKYPYSEYKYKIPSVRTGTGFVFSTFTATLKNKRFPLKNKRCPCHECRICPEKAETTYHIVYISTAAHVVYDSSEAEYAVCELFYDSDDRSTVKNLYGVRLVDDDTFKRNSPEFKDKEMLKCYSDRVRLECVTHDQNTIDKLMDNIQSSFIDLKFVFPSAVNISHPHGGCKKISIGKILHREVALPIEYLRNSRRPTYQFGPNTKFRNVASLKDSAISEVEPPPKKKRTHNLLSSVGHEDIANVQESGKEFILKDSTTLEVSLSPDAKFLCKIKDQFDPWVSFPKGTTFTFNKLSLSGKDLSFTSQDDLELYLDNETSSYQAPIKRKNMAGAANAFSSNTNTYEQCAPPNHSPPSPNNECYGALVDLLCDWDNAMPVLPCDFRHWPFHMCYNAPTCPGSSGAPVIFFQYGVFCINHSGTLLNGNKWSSTPHFN